MKNQYEFGKALSLILEEKGLRQVDLSSKTGLAKSYISELLQSKKSPELDTLGKICKALNISLSYFILRSLKAENREDEKSRLLEEIRPILFEIDELVYPENYNKKRKPKRPIGFNSDDKSKRIAQSI